MGHTERLRLRHAVCCLQAGSTAGRHAPSPDEPIQKAQACTLEGNGGNVKSGLPLALQLRPTV